MRWLSMLACCCCEPVRLASFTTNSATPRWDLTPYQGPNQATAGTFWRIIEVGFCYPYGYPWYAAGCVDADGRLVGLPNQFVSSYTYNGYLELQIGCENPGSSTQSTTIEWPGSCQTSTFRSLFPC